MRTGTTRTSVLLVLALGGCADEYERIYEGCHPDGDCFFEKARWEQIRTLSGGLASPLGSLPATDNPFADDVLARNLGEVIFLDTGLGPHGASCATCHPPDQWFTAPITRRELGSDEFRGITSVVDSAYYEWHAWHGRKDQLWQLAQVPIEKPSLLDGNRVEVAHHVYEAPYGPYFARAFGEVDLSDIPRVGRPGKPKKKDGEDGDWENDFTCDQKARVNDVFKQVGWALEAYMRQMVSGPSRFDQYVAGDFEALDESEKRGLELFVGKANCIGCHSGPRLTDDDFHNIGLRLEPEKSDRALAIEELLGEGDPQCPSNAPQRDLQVTDDLRGAFRTPSLRNVAMTAPYMHTSEYEDLFDVVWHYDATHAAAVGVLDSRMWTLELTPAEIEDIVAFLGTLTSTSCSWMPDGVCPPPL